MELDKPRNEVLFAKDGSLNLTGLFKLPASEAKPDEPPSDPFPLRIGSIKLVDGYLHFEDLRPSEPIEFLYDNMNLELKNLSTLPNDNADMTLVANGPNGGRIDWKGTLSLSPIASEGTLKVTDAKMKLFWPYVRDAVPLVLEDGVLSLMRITRSTSPNRPSCCWITCRCASRRSQSRHRMAARWRAWPAWT